jgi:hypothetical protein
VTVTVDRVTGPWCDDCYRRGGNAVLYVVKIEQGPRIGTRVTYAHVARNPACGISRIKAKHP